MCARTTRYTGQSTVMQRLMLAQDTHAKCVCHALSPRYALGYLETMGVKRGQSVMQARRKQESYTYAAP